MSFYHAQVTHTFFLNIYMTFKIDIRRETYTGVQRIEGGYFSKIHPRHFHHYDEMYMSFYHAQVTHTFFLNIYMTFKIDIRRETYKGVQRIEGGYFSTKQPRHFHHYDEMYISFYHAFSEH